jgi:hypothetical protein
MRSTKYCSLLVLFVFAGLFAASCSNKAGGAAEKIAPAYLEEMEGSEFSRVVLTDAAVERLKIQTDAVREQQVNGSQRTVIPYSAVIYGLNGETWAYVNVDMNAFVRQSIKIDFIEDDTAVLLEGLAPGVNVATVGVPELYGIDTGVSK